MIQLASQCDANDDDWERFLPPDYREIVSRSVSPLNYATRKELYLKLCDFPILIDGGELSFVLDKETGKKCFMIGGKGLKISTGAAPYWDWTPSWHWEWTSYPHSRGSLII
ncbi:UNVERIFIED_CONTAM: putative F-box protein PP2-B12 [Sesamum radiatum]|uniref:F-box protein PP2-B12 n=1 Tax=Sesamum radiatum TaxID=300843 RepID=A0AAW2SLM6_SESRA